MTDIKVVIKIRPLIEREKLSGAENQWEIVDGNILAPIKLNNRQYTPMQFDHVFDENRTTEELYNTVAAPVVTSALRGFNGTIFAYGQTGSGKTFSMQGTAENPGIIPIAIDNIFRQIESDTHRKWLLRVSFIEIYNERIFDLLADRRELTKICESAPGEVYLASDTEALFEAMVSTPEHMMREYERGNSHRSTNETAMNDKSSRSHSIFRIVIESEDCTGKKDEEEIVQMAALNLVDLAGSERAELTKSTGERLREGGNINKSLLALSQVIRQIDTHQQQNQQNGENIYKYISYRDSKLTRILANSLGGNAKTVIICTITLASAEETFSTLNFACNAKNVKNQPIVNKSVSDKASMKRLQKRIKELQEELLKAQNAQKSPNSENLVNKINRLQNLFIEHHPPESNDKNMIARRRTWMCSTSGNEFKVPLPPPSVVQAPPPFLTTVGFENFDNAMGEENLSDEIFLSPSKINFERILDTNGARDTGELLTLIRTPKSLKALAGAQQFLKSPKMGQFHINDPFKRIEDLENELQELKDFMSVEEYMAKDSSAQNQQYQVEITKLTDENLKMKRMEAEMAQKLKEAEHKTKQCEQQAKQATFTLAGVQIELEQSKQKADRRVNEVLATLKEERELSNVGELNQKIKALEEMLKSHEKELWVKTEENTKLIEREKEFLAKNDKKSAEQNDIVKCLQERLQKTEKELEDFKSNDSRDEIIAKLEKEHQEMLTGAQATSSEYEKQMAELNAKILSLEEKVRENETELTQEKTNVDALKQKLESQSDEKIKELEEKLQKAQEELSSKSSASDQNNDYDTLKKEFDEQQEEYLKLSDQIMEHVQNADDMQNKVTTLEAELKAKGKELLMTQREMSDMEDDLYAERAKTKSLREEMSDMKDNFGEAVKLQEDVEKLQDELDDAKKLIASYESNQEKVVNGRVEELDNDDIFGKIILKMHRNSAITETLELENLQLQTEIDAFRTQLPELLTKINSMADELDVTSKKLEESLKNCQEKDTMIDDLRCQLEDNDESSLINGLKARAQEYEKTIQELEEKLKNVKDVPAILNQDVADDLHQQMQSMTRENESLKATLRECESLDDEVKNLTEENKKLQATVDDLVAKIPIKTEAEDLDESFNNSMTDEKPIETLKAQIEELMKELAEEAKKNEQLQSEIVDLKDSTRLFEDLKCGALQVAEQVKQSEAEIEEKKRQISELESKLAEAGKAIEQLKANETEIDEKKRQISELEEKLVEASKAIEQLKANETEMTKMEQEIVDLKEKLAGAQQLDGKVQEKELELADKLWKFVELEGELAEASKAIEKFKKNEMKAVKVAKAHETELAEKKLAISDLQAKLAEGNARHEQMDKSIKDLKAVHGEAVEKYEKLKATFEENTTEKDGQIEERALQIYDLEGQIVDLNSQLSKFEAQGTNLQSIVLMKNEKIAQIENELQDTKMRLKLRTADSRSKEETLESCVQELNEKLGEAEAFKAKIAKELTMCQFELAAANSKIEQLKRNHDILDTKFLQECSDNFINKRTVCELREENELLSDQLEYITTGKEKKKTSISPKLRHSSENDGEAAHALASRQLLAETYSGTPIRKIQSSNNQRTRRKSVHDANRRLSVWEQFVSTACQTDITDCGCKELQERLNKANSEIKILNCKISNFERMQASNPLKNDLKRVETDLEKERRAHAKAKQDLEDSHKNIGDAKAKIDENQKKFDELNTKFKILVKNQRKQLKRPETCETGVNTDVPPKKCEIATNTEIPPKTCEISTNTDVLPKQRTIATNTDVPKRPDHCTRGINTDIVLLRPETKESGDSTDITYLDLCTKEEFFVMQEEKYEAERITRDYKMLVQKLQDRLFHHAQLLDGKDDGNENVPENGQSVPENGLNIPIIGQDAPPYTYNVLVEKYEMAKRLCNNRQYEIHFLKNVEMNYARAEHEKHDYVRRMEEQAKKDTIIIAEKYQILLAKYEMAKDVCEQRRQKLNALRAKYGEPIPPAKNYKNSPEKVNPIPPEPELVDDDEMPEEDDDEFYDFPPLTMEQIAGFPMKDEASGTSSQDEAAGTST